MGGPGSGRRPSGGGKNSKYYKVKIRPKKGETKAEHALRQYYAIKRR